VIQQFYPRAWQHLQAARGLKSETASIWSSVLDGGLVEQAVVVDPDGAGRMLVSANWQQGDQQRLTDSFRSCVEACWACLDSLIAETVESFSVLKRPRNPHRPRFFPIADSREDFEALLGESCLDGILQLQFEMVRDCQPFWGQADDESVDQFRNGLRLLLEWEHALERGAQLGAWATPIEPQIHVEAPVLVESLTPADPGAIDQDRVLATYQLQNYALGSTVAGQANTNVDLCLTDGFVPASIDDTLDARVMSVLDMVTRFAVSFAWLSSRIPGARRVLNAGVTNAGNWTDATQSPRRWSADELAQLTESDSGIARAAGTDELTLIVATSEGVYERVIPHASPLRDHPRRGVAAEAAVQDAAATWGLPDFVLAPNVERKGRGVREISDGLLVVGRRGVVVQAKTREADPRSPEREIAWINRQISAAVKQINGTVRRLTAQEAQMINGRGRTVRVDGPSIEWVGVVIIEHSGPPQELAVVAPDGRAPIVVLMRREWEFLFDQLRSTHAVVSYLHRVGEPTELLGTEPERYYELAAADAAATPGPVEPELQGVGEPRSVPSLPAAPAGSDDSEAHGMVRIMLEDIATTAIEPDREDARQQVLASIDSLPVGHRTELGRLLLDGMSAARQVPPSDVRWQFRTFLGGADHDQLGFGVCSKLTEETRGAFMAWLQLRHHEWGQRTGATDLTSIGVLLTPTNDGYREWDTTLSAVHGDLELADEDLQQYRELWNREQ
jgi:hypothetical protein